MQLCTWQCLHTGDCGAPRLVCRFIGRSEVQTHELRINAPISDTMISNSWSIHE